MDKVIVVVVVVVVVVVECYCFLINIIVEPPHSPHPAFCCRVVSLFKKSMHFAAEWRPDRKPVFCCCSAVCVRARNMWLFVF